MCEALHLNNENKPRLIRILLVEDDAFQRLALIDILTICNYEGKE